MIEFPDISEEDRKKEGAASPGGGSSPDDAETPASQETQPPEEEPSSPNDSYPFLEEEAVRSPSPIDFFSLKDLVAEVVKKATVPVPEEVHRPDAETPYSIEFSSDEEGRISALKVHEMTLANEHRKDPYSIEFSSAEIGESTLPASPGRAEAAGAGESCGDEVVPPGRSTNVEDLYKKAVAFAEGILDTKWDLTDSTTGQIRHLIEDLIASIQNGDQQLFESLFHHLSPSSDPLSLNLVNVCVLSLELGMDLGYSRTQLMDLGAAAFLHDVGMRKHRKLVSHPRGLNKHERILIQDHTQTASEIFGKAEDSYKGHVLQAITQEHERVDGSGYPQGLKNGDIAEYARIIGLVDVYEALTHERPYRKAYSSLEAVKILAQDKHLFDRKLMKLFLQRIGFYPKGTFVELNTREIAQVVRQNDGMPLSPVVKVVYDKQGKKLEKTREIDLSTGTRNFIRKGL